MDFLEIFGIVGMILAFIIPFVLHSKAKTWFHGWGACQWLNSPCIFSKAKPREGFHSLCSGEAEWLCDNHYEESLRIRDYVNRVSKERRAVSSDEVKRFKESGHRTW